MARLRDTTIYGDLEVTGRIISPLEGDLGDLVESKKTELNEHTDIKKEEVNEYVDVKKSEVDDFAETAMDNYLIEKKYILDRYNDEKKSELDSYVTVAEEAVNLISVQEDEPENKKKIWFDTSDSENYIPGDYVDAFRDAISKLEYELRLINNVLDGTIDCGEFDDMEFEEEIYDGGTF